MKKDQQSKQTGTFCDLLDYCDVWGHDETSRLNWHVIDIVGTLEKEEWCKRCRKHRYITKSQKSFGMIGEPKPHYGEWF